MAGSRSRVTGSTISTSLPVADASGGRRVGENRLVPVAAIYAAALLLATAAMASALILADDASTRALLAARYTARAAFLGFVFVYLAGPARKLWPESAIVRGLAPRARHLGLAFALLMLVHLAALAVNVGFYRPRTLGSIALGGTVYMLLFAMALSSTDAAQRRMGEWWRRLHFIGLNAALATFLTSYASRLFRADYAITGAIFTPLVLALLAVRLWAGRSSGRATLA